MVAEQFDLASFKGVFEMFAFAIKLVSSTTAVVFGSKIADGFHFLVCVLYDF